MPNKRFIFLLIMMFTGITSGYGNFLLDIEGGKVYSQYNDIAVPGNSGTRFSFTDDLKSENPYFYRLKTEYTWKNKHTFGLLYAPLEVKSSGTINKEISFNNKVFIANEKINAKYQFNSYRATYRYMFFNNEKYEFGLGITGKIRDASIKLENSFVSAEKNNIGFVPLINFKFSYSPVESLKLIAEGDFLAAKQGRAEDLLLAIEWKISKNIGIKAGYRLLEGGSDGDEVYTFALFNYALAGIVIRF